MCLVAVRRELVIDESKDLVDARAKRIERRDLLNCPRHL